MLVATSSHSASRCAQSHVGEDVVLPGISRKPAKKENTELTTDSGPFMSVMERIESKAQQVCMRPALSASTHLSTLLCT